MDSEIKEEFAAVRAHLKTVDECVSDADGRVREEGIATRPHFDVVAESLRDDIRIIAEGLIALDAKVRNDAEGLHQSMHACIRRIVVVIILIASNVATGSTGQLDVPPTATSIDVAVKEAYAREFGELIERPAIHNDPLAGGCKGREPHLMTTAYFRRSPKTARLLYLYTTPDARTVIRKSEVASVISPAGKFRVLAVIVRHPATVPDSDLADWQAAQAKINQDHATFAASRGLAEPIVSFENTNVLVDPGEIANPSSPASVRDAAERRGFATQSFDFIATINLDPARPAGGFAGPDGFVYMGNYSRWRRRLTAAEWVNVANAVYHHEVAHHWGWPGSHDWAPRCGRQPAGHPFIVSPILFGWEDVDGDRTPEILDVTPYGRPQ